MSTPMLKTKTKTGVAIALVTFAVISSVAAATIIIRRNGGSSLVDSVKNVITRKSVTPGSETIAPSTSGAAEDGENYLVKGATSGQEDFCSENCNSSTKTNSGNCLHEFYPDNNQTKERKVACEFGCEGGACQQASNCNNPTGEKTLTIDSIKPETTIQTDISVKDNTGTSTVKTLATKTYATGTQVTLTAPATANGQAFSLWDGCDIVDSAARKCTIIMNSNKTVKGVYGFTVITPNVAWNTIKHSFDSKQLRYYVFQQNDFSNGVIEFHQTSGDISGNVHILVQKGVNAGITLNNHYDEALVFYNANNGVKHGHHYFKSYGNGETSAWARMKASAIEQEFIILSKSTIDGMATVENMVGTYYIILKNESSTKSVHEVFVMAH